MGSGVLKRHLHFFLKHLIFQAYLVFFQLQPWNFPQKPWFLYWRTLETKMWALNGSWMTTGAVAPRASAGRVKIMCMYANSWMHTYFSVSEHIFTCNIHSYIIILTSSISIQHQSLSFETYFSSNGNPHSHDPQQIHLPVHLSHTHEAAEFTVTVWARDGLTRGSLHAVLTVFSPTLSWKQCCSPKLPKLILFLPKVF